MATTPDPIAYGPTGFRCGCGKDAHSNLLACLPQIDDDICGDEYDADVCDLEPGHDGDHRADATLGWPA
jgi:hypothetical protein